jgi:hypothetical protein
MTIRMVQSFLI